MMSQARGQAEEILAEARRVAESQKKRLRDELEVDRQRRLEETERQIQAETQRALSVIRAEVADLTVVATKKVTGKILDEQDHKRLIEDAIRDLDFSVLEGSSRN
jgi:F-type H+-transporting ATPase subunit b